jgi:transposase-like protein
MIDMIKNAKELIAKGKLLNDPELVQMGMDLLNQYDPDQMSETVENNGPLKTDTLYYHCHNCKYTFPVDKEGRKKCPECKKHKLKIDQATNIELTPKKTHELEQFNMQIRKTDKNRVRYNEDGQQEGTYTKSESIGPIKNVWDDNGTEEQDDANTTLKQFTHFSPRTRPHVKMVEVQCDRCKSIRLENPIHVRNRARYVCARCVGQGRLG